MAQKKQSTAVYDESKIQTLSPLEHIRLRPGMYIGRLGNGSDPEDGIYILLKEVIDNSIDEFIMGYGRIVDVRVNADNSVSVRDYGRGIPLGKVVDCVSIINTGAKYNDDVFQFSVGLNGVGTKAVNGLSAWFRVTSFREGKAAEAIFEKGELKSSRNFNSPSDADGTLIEFLPDPDLFSDYAFNLDFIEYRVWKYACLNSGLRIMFNGRKFESRNGLIDFLAKEAGEDILYEPLHYRNNTIEFTFTHTQSYGETYYSFVNGQYTSDGGTHQSAFREGILKGVNEFLKKNYSGIDVREGIAGAIAIKIKSPVFESQTKNKLGNTDIRGWIVSEVKDVVVDLLHKNPEVAKKIETKIVHNESLRKELNAVKKEAREAAKRIMIKIPNFRDCKYHLGDKKSGDQSTIFITEGQSAAGSIVSSRDVYTQAIYTLRGKPQNVYGRNRAEIYKNAELYNLMMALAIEDGIDSLRFNRIVIATDADVDGFHIRNLLLTFFLNYFEELVISGHVWILETPLFRVRNKKQTVYCYSGKERDVALKTITNPEVTRFKGLGEISPKEFGQFIGEDMRLIKAGVVSITKIRSTLDFYMGKNTPDRREYIMENLI